MDLKIGNLMEHSTLTVRIQVPRRTLWRIWLGVTILKAAMWFGARVLGCKLEMMEAIHDGRDDSL